jgi:hypothetical protein
VPRQKSVQQRLSCGPRGIVRRRSFLTTRWAAKRCMKLTTAEARSGAHEYSAPQCPTESHPLLSGYSRGFETDPTKGCGVFFARQNIAEFWNVATRPTERNGLGLSTEQVLQEVSNIEKSLTLLPDIRAIYSAWKQIVAATRCRGLGFMMPVWSPS